MIQIKNINKIYQTGEVAFAALNNISLNISAGEYVLLTGRSGSGKSTLLNILTGVDTPSDGEVFIGKERITGLDENGLAHWRGSNLGIVFQFFQLIPTLSVLENILLPMDLVNVVPKAQREQKAISLLQLVGMDSHKDKMPSSLSGGEQQRIAIARSLANDAPLIVADEPTGNLDSANAEMIFGLLQTLNHQGKTIVMVTHEREIIKGSTRRVVLQDGRILEDARIGKGGVVLETAI